jgi:hypothetical protein
MNWENNSSLTLISLEYYYPIRSKPLSNIVNLWYIESMWNVGSRCKKSSDFFRIKILMTNHTKSSNSFSEDIMKCSVDWVAASISDYEDQDCLNIKTKTDGSKFPKVCISAFRHV